MAPANPNPNDPDPFEGWNDDILSPKTRSAIYALALSIGTLVTFYGLATKEEVALWIGFFMDAVAVITAFVHRPTRGTGSLR